MRSIAVTSQSEWRDFQFFDQEPWSEFKREVARRGCKIVGLNENPDLIVVFNHKNPGYLANREKFKGIDKILVIFEPAVVAPNNHARSIRSRYQAVYVPSPRWKMEKEDRVFDWPQTSSEGIESRDDSIIRQDRFVMILGNHVSVGKSELYSLRREIALIKDLPLDVFGPNWNESTLRSASRGLKSLWKFLIARKFEITIPNKLSIRGKSVNYLGKVDNKFDTYRKYKFALVIENSSDYLSEKLIDAVISGTIPIYVGPNLEGFGIPADLALQVSGDAPSIQEAMGKLMNSREVQSSILLAGREFLNSPRYLEMVNTRALRKLATMIVSDLQDGQD